MKLNRSQTHLIKGLAIIMVIASHFRKVYDLPETVQNLLNPCGYLGVGLFLMVSGYGCAVSCSENCFGTFVKRVSRLIVPLTSATVITVLIQIILKITPPSPLLIIFQCIGLNHQICSAAWYISLQYLCWFSFLFLGNQYSMIKILIWGFCLSFVILMFSIWVDVDGLFLDLWGLNAFSFVAGVIMSMYNIGKKTLIVSLSLFVTLFIFCYFLMGNPTDLLLRNPLKSLIAVLFVIMVFSLTMLLPIKNVPHIFLLVGQNAYYIYLAHVFFAFCFGKFVLGLSFSEAFVIFAFVTLLGSFVLKRIDDKLRQLKWMK